MEGTELPLLDVDCMGDRAAINAQKKGFYDDMKSVALLVDKHGTQADKDFLKQIWLNHRLMLVVTELAEAAEAVRDKNYSCEPKSGGFGEELADAQIRLADLFAHALPLHTNGKTLKAKMAYNESRPHKHGRTL